MPYFGVESAIRKRFSEAGSLCPNTRVAESAFAEASRTVSQLDIVLMGRQGPLSFPVFAEDPQGKDVDHWPSISFRHLRDRFRADEAYQTAIDRDCLGCVEVVNSRGEIVRGPDLVRERPAARPTSVIYEFWIESDNDTDGKRLLSFLKRLFPPRGALAVTRNDGSVANIDMLMTQDAFRSKGFDPTLDPGDVGTRWFRYSLIYDVEAYEDNTLDGEWKQTIVRPCSDLQLIVSEEINLIGGT